MSDTTNTSYLLFVGSYTNFDILAHLPYNEKVGNGVYCMNFVNGSIEMVDIVPCVNPAVLHFDKRDVNTLYICSEGIIENGTIHTIRVKPQISNKSRTNTSNTSNTNSGSGSGNNSPNGNNNSNLNSNSPSLSLTVKTDFENENVLTGGKSLCYFGVNFKHGIAINYWQGSVDVYELDKINGINKEKGILQHIEHNDIATKIEKMSNRRQVKHREDHWVNRQCGSHAHSSHFWKNWVFIPDLGDNSIYQYRYYENGKNGDSSKIIDYECQIGLKYGCGPRHMVFHPTLNVVYVSNELNSTITVLIIDENGFSEDGSCNNSVARMKPIQYVSTISKTGHSTQKDSKNYVAEICLSPDGSDIYVSNRGHDTIAHFRLDLNNNGKILEYSKDFVPTYGQCPRHFAVTPNGRYMLVANQDTNSITVFERNLQDGTLTYKSQFVDKKFGAPNFLLFYPISNQELNNSGKKMTNSPITIKMNDSLTIKGKRSGFDLFGNPATVPILLIFAAIIGVVVLISIL